MKKYRVDHKDCLIDDKGNLKYDNRNYNKISSVARKGKGYVVLEFEQKVDSADLERFAGYVAKFMEGNTRKRFYTKPSYNRAFFSGTGDAIVFVGDNKEPVLAEREIHIRTNCGPYVSQKNISISSADISEEIPEEQKLIDKFYKKMKGSMRNNVTFENNIL